MISQQLLDEVASQVRQHCRQHCRQAKGYEEGPWVNPLTPSDSVSAFMMARFLTEEKTFDQYVSVAPEGHVYGYFFERLGVPILSVHVDYSPRRCELLDDLTVLRNARVLILEDDVVSGITLRLVLNALQAYGPRSLALYLGRRKEDQQVESIAPEIESVFFAEDHLDPTLRAQYESEFVRFFEAT